MRIQLINMPHDPDPIAAGTRGTVIGRDDIGDLLVEWDDGRDLKLIPGVDEWEEI